MFGAVNPGDGGRDILVREVLDDAARRLDSGMEEQPEIQAALHEALGNTYRSLGQYKEAESQLRATVTILQGLAGIDELDYAACLCNLAAVQGSRGAFSEAEDLYRQALAIYRERLERTNPLLALT